jgi:Cu-Zn family superoxide dismutase
MSTNENKTPKIENTELQKVDVLLNAKNESNVSGKIKFIQSGNVVKMTAKVTGLTEGMHAIHIHEKSDCSSADGTSAGGHWNPTAQPHGKWGADTGYHKGDIGNFMVNDQKFTTIEFATDEWCIGCGDETKDILGKGIIVHQGVDDFISQPSGAAGSRVSCAGIIK